MKKCSGRACKCKRNQCQWDCDTVADCKKHYCKKADFVMDHGNCRNDKDCSKHVLMCQDKSCICKDFKSDPGIPKMKEKCLKEERASPRGCEKKAKYQREETR